MKAWHEQDEFWGTFGPMMFSPERFEGANEQVNLLIELSGVEPGAAVLDYDHEAKRLTLVGRKT